MKVTRYQDKRGWRYAVVRSDAGYSIVSLDLRGAMREYKARYCTVGLAQAALDKRASDYGWKEEEADAE